MRLVAARPIRAMPRLGPLARLAVASLLLCLVFAGVGSWLIDTRLTELMLVQVTARATDHVQLGVMQRVQAADFDAPHTSEQLQAIAGRLDPLLVRIREAGSDVLRVNLFAPDGTIVYSDLASLRGRVESPLGDPLLADALAGRARAEISSLSREENSDLKPRYGQALEAYVPVIMAGRVVGAYELYQDTARLQMVRPLVWGIVVGAFTLLYPAVGLATLVGLPRIKASLRAHRKQALDTPLDGAACNLTRREMQVLLLLARDQTYRSIADELVVSEETVRTHVKSILHKLKQPDRRQAVRAAIRAGIVPPSPTAASVG